MDPTRAAQTDRFRTIELQNTFYPRVVAIDLDATISKTGESRLYGLCERLYSLVWCPTGH
jgi:hypothetical protein